MPVPSTSRAALKPALATGANPKRCLTEDDPPPAPLSRPGLLPFAVGPLRCSFTQPQSLPRVGRACSCPTHPAPVDTPDTVPEAAYGSAAARDGAKGLERLNVGRRRTSRGARRRRPPPPTIGAGSTPLTMGIRGRGIGSVMRMMVTAAGILLVVAAASHRVDANGPARAGRLRALAADRKRKRLLWSRDTAPSLSIERRRREQGILQGHGPLTAQEATSLAASQVKIATAAAQKRLGRQPSWPIFHDVSVQSGLSTQKTLKFGGPVIADLDLDGHYDLVLPQHNDRNATRVYWNKGDGTFLPGERVQPGWKDVHGITAGQLRLQGRQTLDLLVMLGGNNGESPSAPSMLKVTKNKKLQEESKKMGVGSRTMRGRSPRLIDLNKDGKLDLVFVNYARTGSYKGPRQVVYRNMGGGHMRMLQQTGFEYADAEQALVCDFDGNNIPDLITWPWPRFYRSTGAFMFEDVTEEMLWTMGDSRALARRLKGIRAVAELDYDNDGKMDLYFARTNHYNDVLLRNMGGYYVDVSRAARIEHRGDHRGVTVGDVNNDGFMDLMVFRYGGKRLTDLMLINQGDGTFKPFKSHGAVVESNNGRGDMGQFFLADNDGKLDLLVGNGDHDLQAAAGTWSLFHNVLPNRWSGNYLIVEVGKAWDSSAAALGAVVRVDIGGGVVLTSRVGSAGASYNQSNLSIVHVGIGKVGQVTSVNVQWTNGKTANKMWVKANTKIRLGVF
eukprot:TRINITY_DN2206_c0_g1_i3.p1 TRINITY_DN2206_c0_g1~~TRINITY_DN2206_c0_g1_i3.p1  ORF type:complete len:729 (+),score=173.35 TRINITY_DN2206_c0_g1_i3:97-2283(+)